MNTIPYASEEGYLSYLQQLARIAEKRPAGMPLKDEEVKMLKGLCARDGAYDLLIPLALEKAKAFKEEKELSDNEAELTATYLPRAGKLPKMHRKIFWPWKKMGAVKLVEAIVVDSIENPTKVLLALRPEGDPNYKGRHSTGSFQGAGETNAEAIARCIENETGCKVRRAEFATTTSFPNCLRGHEEGAVYFVELDWEPTPEMMETHRLQWYDMNVLPDDLLWCHVPLHKKKVPQWFNFYLNRLPKELRTEFLEAIRPIECMGVDGLLPES